MEIWKSIKYNQAYSISNYGRVKNESTGNIRNLNPEANGYCFVNLGGRRNRKKYAVHRLVAEHFLKGDTSLTVDHIDGNKTNNHFTNLQFLSLADNASKAQINKMHALKVSDGSNIYEFESIAQASRVLNLPYTTAYKIYQKGKSKQFKLITNEK